MNRGAVGSLAKRALWTLGVPLLACLLCVSALYGQTTEKAPKPSRRLIHKVEAEYPMALQRAHIRGVVRLEVAVTPAGTVSHISVLGGNPVLVETASQAVKQWRWAPADEESSIRISVNFDSPK